MRHFVITAAMLLTLSTAQADVLSIADPRYDVPNSAEGVMRPTQGMDMAQVEQKFGTPVSKHAAVGDPPISRWSYDTFDVFFEYDKVIHAVVNRPDPE
jgi:hypothetical protein